MGGRKPFLELKGKPVIYHTLDRFLPFHARIAQTILLLHADDVEAVRRDLGRELASLYHVTDIIPGGERRQDSVWIGLEHTRAEAGIVAIHDGVRPFVSRRAIAESFAKAEQCGAAIVASPMKPSVKRVSDGYVTENIHRAGLWGAQTPQVFRRDLIVRAYEAAKRDSLEVTDDAQLVAHIGARVAVVPDSDLNIKITTPEDLRLAEAILEARLLDRDYPS